MSSTQNSSDSVSQNDPGKFPALLMPDAETIPNIPNVLKNIPRCWVLSGAKWRGGKLGKPPLYKAGRTSSGPIIKFAHTDDPSTLTHFANAVQALKAGQGRIVDIDGPTLVMGLGIVMKHEMGILGIDLDHAYDPAAKTTAAWAAPIVEALLSSGTYVERSPSGTGFRAFAKGTLPGGANLIKQGPIEVYAHGHYLTVTGARLSKDSKVVPAPEAMEAIYEAVDKRTWETTPAAQESIPADSRLGDDGNLQAPCSPPPVRVSNEPRQGTTGDGRLPQGGERVAPVVEPSRAAVTETYVPSPATFTDDRLWQVMFKSRGGDQIQQWYSVGYLPSDDQSSIDKKMADRLAFYTGKDRARMISMMRQTALYASSDRAAKWDKKHSEDGRTYLEMTVDAAISSFSGETFLQNAEPRPVPVVTEEYREEVGANGEVAVSVTTDRKVPKLQIPLADGIPVPPESSDGTPVIPYGTNFLAPDAAHWQTNLMHYAEGVLNDRLFNYSNVLSQLVIEERADSSHPGEEPRIAIQAVIPETLASILDKRTAGKKLCCRTKTPVWAYSFPDRAFTKSIVFNIGNWNLRMMKGVTTSPVFCYSPERHTCRIICKPGFDQGTGLFCAIDLKNYPVDKLDFYKTAEGREATRALLNQVLGECAFVSVRDRAAAISMLLCAVMRPAMKTCPMYAITATKAGTGKTQLAKVASILARGRTEPSVVTYTPDENEFRKLMFALLLKGVPVVIVDNVPARTEVTNPAFEAALSSESYEGRILGKTDSRMVPTRSLFIASGNNLTPAQDMVRRTILIRLNRSETENPATWNYANKHLDSWVLEHRGEIIIALLGLLSAYVEAGRPKLADDLPDFVGYPEWDEVVRGATIWLMAEADKTAPANWIRDELDPVGSQATMRENDPVQQGILNLFECWQRAYRKEDGKRITAPQPASELATRPPEDPEVKKSWDARLVAFCEAVENVLPGGGKVTAKRLGQYLRSIKGANYGGMTVNSVIRDGVTYWFLERAKAK